MPRQKLHPKLLNLGIYVIGEGLTEQHYFRHLKSLFNYRCTIRPRLFRNTCINDIEQRIEEVLAGDVIVICVFDADVTLRNSKENLRLKNLQSKYHLNPNVVFCDSFPSIEYWFLLHYIKTCPQITTSLEAEKRLKKYNPSYEKTSRFLESETWVREMSLKSNGLNNAIQRARNFGTDGPCYSKIFLAIEKLKESIE